MVTRLDNMNLPPDLSSISTEDVIRLAVRQYKDAVVTNRQAPTGGEINDFFPLVHNALISKQRAEGFDDDKMVLFVEEDPPEKLDTEAITFYIQARSPGQFAQGPTGTRTHKEVRQHIRSVQEHPEHPGEHLITAGKWYDNNIRFNVYAKTNKQARQRLIWFTQLMDAYRWYFAMSGYDRVEEQGVGDRERIEIKEYGIVTRYPVSYMVRSEDVQHYGTQELQQVAFTVDTESQ